MIATSSDLESDASARALAAIETALRVGSATIGTARVALGAAGSALREIRALLVKATNPRVDRISIQSAIDDLRARVKAEAEAATLDGVNLVWIGADAEEGDEVYSIVSALARGTSGGMTIRSIEIDRDMTALFDERRTAKGPSGIFGRVDPRSGASIATFDVSRLTDSAADALLLAHYLRQVETAIASVALAGSELSLACSRIDLQTSFIDSILADVSRSIVPTVDLDRAGAKLRAIETKALLLRQQALSIANLNTQTILKLFQNP